MIDMRRALPGQVHSDTTVTTMEFQASHGPLANDQQTLKSATIPLSPDSENILIERSLTGLDDILYSWYMCITTRIQVKNAGQRSLRNIDKVVRRCSVSMAPKTISAKVRSIRLEGTTGIYAQLQVPAPTADAYG